MGNSVDDFLNHKGREGRGAMLKGWKKGGEIDTWNHVACFPLAVWRHGGIPKKVVLEDKKTGESRIRVWGGQWSCHEDEGVLKAQYHRTNGARDVPANYCPLCRLVDVVEEMVTSGQLDWLQPVFRFDADDPKETVILHAGGLFMSRKQYEDLDKKERDRAKAAGVFLKDMAWKENSFAKLEYLFRVVDNAHPESGVQITFERASLGDKVKEVIRDQRKDRGVEEGDPFKHPYAIQWEYNKDETDPRAMYKARARLTLPLTPAISALIHGPAPDIAKYVEPFNIQQMRTDLEEAALIELPFDRIFDVRKRAPKAPESSTRLAKSPAAKEAPKAAPEPEPTPSRQVRPPPRRAAFPSEDDPHAVACEGKLPDGSECGKAMWDDATTCPHCGAEYELKNGAYVLKPREAPKPALRKRSQPKAEPEALPEAPPPLPVRTRAEAKPPMREPGDDSDVIGQHDEDSDGIPFIFCEMGPGERWLREKPNYAIRF